ncbi:MAG: hypothetical protein ACXADH_17270 [Candidatus Kariarchaeaceae archaeon]|jgi:hypothetical protein
MRRHELKEEAVKAAMDKAIEDELRKNWHLILNQPVIRFEDRCPL